LRDLQTLLDSLFEGLLIAEDIVQFAGVSQKMSLLRIGQIVDYLLQFIQRVPAARKDFWPTR
jgi:hypothetical protein